MINPSMQTKDPHRATSVETLVVPYYMRDI